MRGRRSRTYVVNPGDQFGCLTVIDRWGYHCRCKCSCGSLWQGLIYSLFNGVTRSCGCLLSERAASLGRARATHGYAGSGKSPEYRSWLSMKARCLNPRAINYGDYGGRGIQLCERWKDDFTAFLADVGPRPATGYSLDRIDVNGNYEPGNVRWATRDDQARNRRDNRFLTHCGETLTITDWSRKLGINRHTIAWRLDRGLPVTTALSVGAKR